MATTQQPRHKSPEVERAQALLRQPVVDGQAILDLIKPLKAERAFGVARKLVDHTLQHPDRTLDPPLPSNSPRDFPSVLQKFRSFIKTPS